MRRKPQTEPLGTRTGFKGHAEENEPSTRHRGWPGRWEKSQKPKVERVKWKRVVNIIGAAERMRRLEKSPKFSNIWVAINHGEQWQIIMGKALKFLKSYHITKLNDLL